MEQAYKWQLTYKNDQQGSVASSPDRDVCIHTLNREPRRISPDPYKLEKMGMHTKNHTKKNKMDQEPPNHGGGINRTIPKNPIGKIMEIEISHQEINHITNNKITMEMRAIMGIMYF